MFVACILICADCKKKSRETHYASKMEAETRRAHQGPAGVSVGPYVSSLDDPVELPLWVNTLTEVRPSEELE